jgi:hypothetical protein
MVLGEMEELVLQALLQVLLLLTQEAVVVLLLDHQELLA